MSNARNLANLLGTDTKIKTADIADEVFNSNRNLVINGAMQVSQRGTSDTGVHASGYYSCDRFSVYYNAEDELRNTITQASDGPDGFANSFKIETTTAESAVASDERLYVMYKAEAQDLQSLGFGTSAAEKTTLSFYVKSSVTGTYAVSLYQSDGNDLIGSTYTINSANTWERKTITFAGNTAAAVADDNGIGIIVYFGIMLGSDWTSGSNTSWAEFASANFFAGHAQNGVATTANATWQITGVQWELGEQATPFEHRSFADELARCQRYYWQVAGQNQIVGQGFYYSTSEFDCIVDLPQTMRASPTFTPSNNSGDFNIAYTTDLFDTWSGIQFFDGTRVNIYATSGVSGTKGDSSYVRLMNSTSKVQFDAEL